MADIMQDKYILGQSQSATIGTIGQEIRLDLSLEPNTNSLNGGTVKGVVRDSAGNPIQNALIKIMSTNYEPLIHTLTDANGNYSFNNLNPGNYTIFAISSGMKLNQGNQFAISNLETRTIDFTLEQDPSMSLSVIAGDLFDQSNNNPIGGAVVSLYKIGANNEETLEAITYTNEYGQFTFREIIISDYIIKISALGYSPVESNVSITTPGQLIAVDLTMVQNPNTSRGTVSGIITDNNNQPIDRADVILYKVEANGALTPLSFTKTTQSGIYLFANVSNGTYKVKANELEVVTVNIAQ